MAGRRQRMSRWFNDASVITKFTVIYVVAILIPSLLVIGYSVKETSTDTRDKVLLTSHFIARDVFANVSQSLAGAADMASHLAINTTLRRYLVGSFEFRADDINELNLKVKPILDYAVQFQGQGLAGAKIVMLNPQLPEAWPFFVSEARMLELDWYARFEKADATTTWAYPSESGVYTRYPIGTITSERTLTHARKMYDTLGRHVATVIVDAPVKGIVAEITHPELNDIHFAITSRTVDYTLMALNPDSGLNTDTVDSWLTIARSTNEDRDLAGWVVFTHWVEGTELAVTALVDVQRQVIAAAGSRLGLAAVIILGLVVLEIGTYLMLNRMFGRLRSMTTVMNLVAGGEFDHRVPVESRDEIGQIAQDFNVLIRKIDDLVTESIRRQTLQKDTELKALQFQINPHFIYNTIDTFRMQLVLAGNDELAEAMAGFGKMLRYNVSSGELYTTIDEDLSYVRKYVDIQRMRYRDLITYNERHDDEVARARVLKFLVQPIVENSIRHGMSSDANVPLRIEIDVHASDGQVVLRVADSGSGISAERLHALREHIAERSDAPLDTDGENGIGLSNIASRLRLYYNTSASMEIVSEPGSGTVVTLRLPLEATNA